jgi:hypothetical protein
MMKNQSEQLGFPEKKKTTGSVNRHYKGMGDPFGDFKVFEAGELTGKDLDDAMEIISAERDEFGINKENKDKIFEITPIIIDKIKYRICKNNGDEQKVTSDKVSDEEFEQYKAMWRKIINTFKDRKFSDGVFKRLEPMIRLEKDRKAEDERARWEEKKDGADDKKAAGQFTTFIDRSQPPEDEDDEKIAV